ncbi:MAG: hypothetical protein BM556_09195 [Bacteriovorax sp. MedPE-SWde]|nr:MAG: hypothetical protein BM556_09195 [Bacteriovorax sp. MedPE-SWde]
MLLLCLAIFELRKWREIILVVFIVSLVLSVPTFTVFYKNYVLMLSFVIAFVLMFFRRTFPSVVSGYSININGKTKVFVCASLVIGFTLLNYIQYRTGLILDKSVVTMGNLIFNIKSEHILRYTAITLMFITIALVKTGESRD